MKKDGFEIYRYSSHYACSCPAWRFQSTNVKDRTCEHLCEVLGDEYERIRVRRDSHAGIQSRSMNRALSSHRTYQSPETTPSKRVKWSSPKDFTEAKSLNMPDLPQEIRITMSDGTPMTMGWRDKKLFVLLANTWPDREKRTADPTQWWMSEKLDGVRAIWDGKHLWSRNGKLWAAPAWFTDRAYGGTNAVLPHRVPLDGELWIDRGLFELTSSICRSTVCDIHLQRPLKIGIRLSTWYVVMITDLDFRYPWIPRRNG